MRGNTSKSEGTSHCSPQQVSLLLNSHFATAYPSERLIHAFLKVETNPGLKVIINKGVVENVSKTSLMYVLSLFQAEKQGKNSTSSHCYQFSYKKCKVPLECLCATFLGCRS